MPENPLRYLDPVVVSQLKTMELRARLVMKGFITGMHRSPFHGFSVEFAEHRPYNPGDELRHIDWKVYGRTGRYYVKQYEEETNLRSYIVLDTSASMHYKHASAVSKLEYAAHLSAGLHALMLKQRDATGLIGFDENIHTMHPPKAKPSYLYTLLSELDTLVRRKPTDSRTGAANALHQVAERIERRSLVVVMTDLFENVGDHADLLKALHHLRHRGHEVIVFHILEGETERKLHFPDRPLVFRDMETGREVTLEPADLREQYREAAEHFTERFHRECRERGIDVAEMDTAESYDTALLAYLKKRERLV